MTFPAGRAATAPRLDAAALHRLVAVTVLGFASGLPLALTGQAMQAWLSVEGVDIATIGFLSLVGLPYTFKFLWAPLMDRFELPWLGRRRGWLVLTQLALAGALFWMAATPPAGAIARLRAARRPGRLRLGLAGRRHRRLPHRPAAGARARPRLVAQRARLPAGDDPLGRRRADLGRPARRAAAGRWPEVYRLMAGLMVGAAVRLGDCCCRACRCAPAPPSVARNDVLGFLAVVAAVGVGFLVTRSARPPLARALLAPLLAHGSDAAPLQRALGSTWSRCCSASPSPLPLAAWAARARALRDAARRPAQLLRASPARRRSSRSSCSTSSATPSPAR